MPMLALKMCFLGSYAWSRSFPYSRRITLRKNSIFKSLDGFVSPVAVQAHHVDRQICSTHSVSSEKGICVFWGHLARESLTINLIVVFSEIQNCLKKLHTSTVQSLFFWLLLTSFTFSSCDMFMSHIIGLKLLKPNHSLY